MEPEAKDYECAGCGRVGPTDFMFLCVRCADAVATDPSESVEAPDG